MPHAELGNFYDLLGVSPQAGPTEIRAAFLRLAQQHHPDLNADDPDADRRFKQTRRVYEILSDPVRRADYDQHPERFRVSGAGVASWDDRDTIVSRPEGAAWSDADQQGRSHVFCPRWLGDRRYRRENQWIFAGVVTTILVLGLLPIVLMRVHRQNGQSSPAPMDNALSSHESSSPQVSQAVEVATAETPEPEPLERVLRSVHALRARPTEQLPDDAERSGDADSAGTDLLPPTFEIIDELDLPRPGWPILSLPIEAPPYPPIAPQLDDDLSRFMLPVYGSAAGSNVVSPPDRLQGMPSPFPNHLSIGPASGNSILPRAFDAAWLPSSVGPPALLRPPTFGAVPSNTYARINPIQGLPPVGAAHGNGRMPMADADGYAAARRLELTLPLPATAPYTTSKSFGRTDASIAADRNEFPGPTGPRRLSEPERSPTYWTGHQSIPAENPLPTQLGMVNLGTPLAVGPMGPTTQPLARPTGLGSQVPRSPIPMRSAPPLRARF